jgi:hypothetical protein
MPCQAKCCSLEVEPKSRCPFADSQSSAPFSVPYPINACNASLLPGLSASLSPCRRCAEPLLANESTAWILCIGSVLPVQHQACIKSSPSLLTDYKCILTTDRHACYELLCSCRMLSIPSKTIEKKDRLGKRWVLRLQSRAFVRWSHDNITELGTLSPLASRGKRHLSSKLSNTGDVE